MSEAVLRARRLLTRPGAWLEAASGGYRVRLHADRRRRAAAGLDEAAFRALAADPGLKLRSGGGWVLQRVGSVAAAPPPGRPGWLEGERVVTDDAGRAHRHRASLGESALAWLSRRKDRDGRPWLTPLEVAAGTRLRAEAERAMKGPSLTQRWDALPRTGGGTAARVEPGQSVLDAGARLDRALSATGDARAVVYTVCVIGTGLTLAETQLGLRRRSAKLLLKRGLGRLADHYAG